MSDRKQALCAQLYDSDEPVSDQAMLAVTKKLRILFPILVGIALSSVAAHAYRLILFGLGTIAALALGIVLTMAVAGLGHLAFEKLVQRSKLLQAVVIGLSALVFFGGVFQLAQAGAAAVAKGNASTASSQSYVEGEDGAASTEPEVTPQADEHHIQQLISSAITKILLGADLGLGILLGTVMVMWTDEKYVTWRRIGELDTQLARKNWELKGLLASLEVAERQCMRGILRFFYGQRKAHPTHYRAAAACALAVVLSVGSAEGQNEKRPEAILIDVSGSIGTGGANKELFREYLVGARQLLLTEPPNSRVVVLLISTDSFGSGRELLKGWTPPARGVFTDDLNRARHELASAFETKVAGASPITAGTDIIGGLWRAKTLLESGTASSGDREIWIFSDMMNETPTLPMPALLAAGPERMLENVKQNGFLVPLNGYRIHVLGASTRGLSPQTWNAMRSFWTQYWQAAGATLVSYSAEASPER